MNVVWLREMMASVGDASKIPRIVRKRATELRLTIVRSCCRWPCLQIYLQSFWMILDENAKVDDVVYGVEVTLMVDASVSSMRGGRRMDGKKRL